MKSPKPPTPSLRDRWYGQPVVWLGAVILLASIVAVVALIVLTWNHPEEPPPPSTDHLLRVPVAREPQRAS